MLDSKGAKITKLGMRREEGMVCHPEYLEAPVKSKDCCGLEVVSKVRSFSFFKLDLVCFCCQVNNTDKGANRF